MSEPNDHTKKIHEKGYSLTEFLNYWNIHVITYRRYCANEKLHDKLNKMIAGLPARE